MYEIKEYSLTLNEDQFLSDYSIFRAATSKTFTYKKRDYAAVYLDYDQYAYVNIISDQGSNDSIELTLIVNLQYYYVFGFKIDGQYFAYQDSALKALQGAGFKIPKSNIIPYGDAYYEIGSHAQIQNVCQENVSLSAIQSSIARIVDLKIGWTDKKEDLLRVFWSLVEGIRFNEISSIVHTLITGNSFNTTFGYFYYMAERWAEMSIGTAYRGKKNSDSSIAVYELNMLKSK